MAMYTSRNFHGLISMSRSLCAEPSTGSGVMAFRAWDVIAGFFDFAKAGLTRSWRRSESIAGRLLVSMQS